MDSSLHPEVLSCLSQASFWSPDYVCHSGWLEHGPFAFWLCDAMRPQCIVELGTHYGYSYFAFCQAVDSLGVNSSAYAIDTWAGDEHAGYYGDDVFKTVSEHNQKHFANFSTLVRSSFDEALTYFADGSIDLLHIDGRHFYDDVKHDFDSWRPKLARHAVVIFHDVNVRERGFGVWKFFSELSEECPAFTFLHGNGLGVLAPNGNPPERLAPMFSASSAMQTQIRSIYAGLGAGIKWRQAFESKLEAFDRIIAAAPVFAPSFRHDLAWSSNGDTQALKVLDVFETHTKAGALQEATLSDAIARERDEHARNIAELTTARSHELNERLVGDRAAAAQDAIRLQEAFAAERAIAAREASRLQRASADERAIAAFEIGRLQDALAAAANRTIEEQQAFAGIRDYWLSERDLLFRQLADSRSLSTGLENSVEAIRASSSWRVTAPLRLVGTAMQALRSGRKVAPHQDVGPHVTADEPLPQALSLEIPAPAQKLEPHAAVVASYDAWSREFDTPTSDDLARLAETVNEVRTATVVIALTATPIERLVDALRHCVGLNLTVALICHANAQAEATALTGLLHESGIMLVELDAIELGTPLIILDGAALPRVHGPRMLIDVLSRDRAIEVVYSDEDVLDADGIPYDPWFKPKFSPRLVAAGVLLGRMVGVSGDAAEMVRSRMSAGGSDLSDVLRAAALSAGESRVVHVPHVLFHNLEPRPEPLSIIPPKLETAPIVSIIIPTKNAWTLLDACLKSLATTNWPSSKLEIIVVDNNSDDLATLRGLKAAETSSAIIVLRDPRPFNYARLNNAAARVARGEFLVLMNNDIVVRNPDWLRELIAEAVIAGTGVVGAKLLYPDDTVQHGGVVLGIQGGCAHAHRTLAENDGGYMGLANLTHEIAANTGACLAVRRDLFFSVGGLNEDFQVAFNDVVLSLDIHKKGYRNVYVGRPLVTHHESKTRGLDDTKEKVRLWLKETKLAWAHHHDILRDDPFYSPNLSFEIPYELSFAPRRRAAWRPAPKHALRVMMLSLTYSKGHGVAVVIDQQVDALARAGHEVILAGHRSVRDFDFAGRKIIEVYDVRSAATLACQLSVDVIVAHTPPFFSVARWTGAYPPTIVYDYGEPPADLFPDAEARRAVGLEKELAFLMATRVLAISEAVAAEADTAPDAVLPLANSHLGRWTADAAKRREAVRAARGWNDRFIVLNVCRFHAGERAYKGVDSYAEILDHLLRIDPSMAIKTVFVLCGKGDPDDVTAMQERGLTVAANVPDEEMADLYAAADVYANFSLWEGYNLGIGQALAMGLPVVASDIPAHRAFDVDVVSDAMEAARVLARLHANLPARVARVTEWTDVLPNFVREVEGVASGRLGRKRCLEVGMHRDSVISTPSVELSNATVP
jgi:GT2 family glycosyltransferase